MFLTKKIFKVSLRPLRAAISRAYAFSSIGVVRYAIIVITFCLLCNIHTIAQPTHIAQQLKEGDILFQKIPCGNLCDAIIETTPCKPGMAFNHCGIVNKKTGKVYVTEAIGERVTNTELEKFLERDMSRYLYAGRLQPKYKKDIPVAIIKAKKYIGTPYDDAFLPGDTALYCSELVWESYKDNGSPLFTLQPMTFKSPKTGATYPAWIAYYQGLNQPIPEGVEGINPCLIANSAKINIVVIDKRK